jgi:hypothetical protein
VVESGPAKSPFTGEGGAARKTSRKAVASLVLGIAGLFPLPVVASVSAILLASLAAREISASGGTVGGMEYARSGRILGMVGLLLDLLVFLAILAVLLVT